MKFIIPLPFTNRGEVYVLGPGEKTARKLKPFTGYFHSIRAGDFPPGTVIYVVMREPDKAYPDFVDPEDLRDDIRLKF